MNSGSVWRLGLGIAACWAALALLRGEVAAAAALFPDALPATPYWVPGEALRLYVAAPLAVVAACGVVFAPGVLFVLAAGGKPRFDELLLHGFGAALLLHIAAHVAMHAATSGALPAGAFLGATAFLTVAGLAFLSFRVRSGRAVSPLVADAADRRRMLWCAALTWLCVALLAPMIHWQDLTDDGAEALATGRSLADFAIPRFPRPGGLMGLGLGMVTTSYPAHWCISIFGPSEAAARLPLALCLPVLFCAVTALAEVRSPRRLGRLEEVAVVVALAGYVVTMTYNASYDPYAADAGVFAPFETLTVICMIGAAHSVWTGATPAVLAFGLLAYFARPTGLLFLGMLGLARWLFEREVRRDTLLRLGSAVAACVAAFVLYEKVYLASVAGPSGLGYTSEGIQERLRFLRFGDVGRALWVVLPCGILPALALGAVRRQDPIARSLAAVSVAYFLFFYFQAYVALHHFVPAMVLPVVVLWRVALAAPPVSWVAPAALAGAAAGFVLSLPPSLDLYRRPRAVAAVTSWEVGDYRGNWEQYRAAIDHRFVWNHVFPADWDVADAPGTWACSPLVAVHYASVLPRAPGPPQYVVRAEGAPAPEGCRKLGGDGVAAAWVRDEVRWAADRAFAPPAEYRSRWYAIPRTTLFPHLGRNARRHDVDLQRVLWRIGLRADPPR